VRSRVKGDFNVGDQVLVHRVAPNRMLPHFTDPYTVASVTADGNFVTATHFVDRSVLGPVHVSRLLHFDASRATPADMVAYQLDAGSFVVEDVLEHRRPADGSLEFHMRWLGTAITYWQASQGVKQVLKVQEYCKRYGLPDPRVAPKAVSVVAAAVAGGSGRGRRTSARRGRGRGQGRP